MINRRDFVSTALGLGLGMGGQPLVQAAEAGQAPLGELPPVEPGFEAYERVLAGAKHLDCLGTPRSWSYVRQGFHPVAPERVVILRHDEGDAFFYGHMRDLVLPGMKGKLPKRAAGTGIREEKATLIVRLMGHLTSYYRVPEYHADWSETALKRELLGSTSLGDNCGLLHQFQVRGGVKTVNAQVDWWLFLFPEGVEWESLDDQPVHALLSHVFTRPRPHNIRLELEVCSVASDAHRAIREKWLDVSRMDRISAARFVNLHIPAALERREQWP